MNEICGFSYIKDMTEISGKSNWPKRIVKDLGPGHGSVYL
jgi:hypothetical protein